MKNKILTLIGSCLFLSGCIGHERGIADLKQFIAKEKAKTPPPIKQVKEFKPVPPFPYSHEDKRDPFSVNVNQEVKPVDPAGMGYLMLPEEVRTHPPEELENFSLDSLKMQGTLRLKGIQWVLIQDPDGTLHRVKRGNYMGKNLGRIISISEEKIILSEYYQVQNGYEPRQSEIVLEGI